MGLKIDIAPSGESGYITGQTRLIEVTCKDDLTGAAVDPTTVIARIGVEVGERRVQTLDTIDTEDWEHTASTGIYQKAYTFTQHGRLRIEVTATGDLETVEVAEINVDPQPTWLPS